MNPYFNDTDFRARHEHYNDMLQAATANIDLRRGEFPEDRSGLRQIVIALAARISAVIRGRVTEVGEGLTVATAPCSDPEPCN